MPAANVLVDVVTAISRPDAPGLAAERRLPYETVAFAGGRSALLDVATQRGRVFAEVLESLREAGHPAYVEIDADSSVITEVRQPIAYRVGTITQVANGLQIELAISHARHFLRRSNPEFDELRRALENARRTGSQLLVTETLDDHEIVDVRPVLGTVTPAPRARRQR